MSLVLTTPSNPGTAAWTDATDLPGARTPFEVISPAGATYTIPDGDSRFLLFVLSAPGSIIVLPSAVSNPGVTLTLCAISTDAATVQTNGFDSIGPYGPPLTLDAAGTPRVLQLVSVPAASQTGQNYWMLVSSV